MPSIRSHIQRTLTRYVFAPYFGPTVSAPAQRRRLNVIGRLLPTPSNTKVTPVNAGGVAAEWVQVGKSADALDAPVILFLHGGGYCIGSPRSHRNLVARLAKGLGGRALVPDYRLAPEHPFPAALNDAVAVYRWLLAQGISAKRIVFAGDSAGGGLVLTTALKLKRDGIELPAAILSISPWTDLTMAGESIDALAKIDPLITRGWMESLADSYCAGQDRRNPLISPLYGDFHGFPPVMLQVASDELLVSEVEALAGKLRNDGVSLDWTMGEQMWHDWQLLGGLMPEANEAIDEAVGFFQRNLVAVEGVWTDPKGEMMWEAA